MGILGVEPKRDLLGLASNLTGLLNLVVFQAQTILQVGPSSLIALISQPEVKVFNLNNALHASRLGLF